MWVRPWLSRPLPGAGSSRLGDVSKVAEKSLNSGSKTLAFPPGKEQHKVEEAIGMDGLEASATLLCPCGLLGDRVLEEVESDVGLHFTDKKTEATAPLFCTGFLTFSRSWAAEYRGGRRKDAVGKIQTSGWISEEELEPFCRLRSQYQHAGPVRSQQPRVPFPSVDGKMARGQG